MGNRYYLGLLLALLPALLFAETYNFSHYTTLSEPSTYIYITTWQESTVYTITTTYDGTSSVNGTTTTETNYDNPNIADFTIQDATTNVVTAPSRWSVVNKVIQQISNIYTQPISSLPIDKEGTIAILTPRTKSQYFRVTGLSGDDDVWGIGFYKDALNKLRFSISKQFGYWRLDKQVNGVWIPQVEIASTYNMNQWYTLEFRSTEYIGGYEVAVDGSPVIQTADTTYQNAKPFLYTWGNTPTYFKDISYGYSTATVYQRPYSYDSTISATSTWSNSSTGYGYIYTPRKLYRLENN